MIYIILLLLILIISFLLGMIFTRIAINVARRLDFYAQPDHRSSHETPTPRIGGIGFALPFFIYLIINKFFYKTMLSNINPEDILLPENLINPLLIGSSIAFILGLLDDIKGLKPIIKLLAQLVIAFIPIAFGMRIFEFYLSSFYVFVISIIAGNIISFLWIIVFMNFFNFMDGMNGKAGTFTLSSLLSIAIIITIKGSNYFYIPLIIVLLAAILGFLRFNYTPAKTFMGDCGSQLLGFVLAFICLHLSSIPTEKTANYIYNPFIAFILILFPFIYDAGYTLLRRTMEGKNILEAHHEHLYQRLLELGYSHEKVLQICQITYIICGISGILYAIFYDEILINIFSILLAFFTMLTYSIFVIKKENQFKKRHEK